MDQRKIDSLQRPQWYTVNTVPRKFVKNSKLHALLAKKYPQIINKKNRKCTLSEALTTTRKLINDEKLYDQKNPTCIWCSKELAEALGMNGLHITELRDLILLQMEITDPCLLGSIVRLSQPEQPQQTCETMSQTEFDKNGTFSLQTRLEKVLQTIPEFPKKGPYTYKEICSAVSEHILDHQETIFDKRNIKMAFLNNDPLGPALGVNLMHRSQVSKLIQRQLIRTSISGTRKLIENIRKRIRKIQMN